MASAPQPQLPLFYKDLTPLNSRDHLKFNSRTLDRAPWGTFEAARISDNPADEVRRMKRAGGKDMVVWGSISLAQSLMDAGVVDEYQLVVCPVVLGEGKPLFRPKDHHQLALVETRSFDRGTVLLSYRAK